MYLFNKQLGLPDRNSQDAPLHRGFNKSYFYRGMLLLMAFSVQEYLDWRWPWLTELQADNRYQQISGFVLLAFLAQQWHCSVLRNQGLMREAGKILHRHKSLGSLAPLVFYAHSQTLGYAYLQALCLVYFAIFLTGLFNFETTGIRQSWFHPVWITVHVGLSTALVFLTVYHVYISYAYH